MGGDITVTASKPLSLQRCRDLRVEVKEQRDVSTWVSPLQTGVSSSEVQVKCLSGGFLNLSPSKTP